MKNITPQEMKEMLKNEAVCLIDVRTAFEFLTGKIGNAINIPYDEIIERVSEIDAEKTDKIIVYCRSGNRSRIAALSLEKIGFTNTFNLSGGILAWKKEV